MVDRERPGIETKTTYLWQYFGFDDGDAPYTVFDFALTRAHTAPLAFLKGFSGTLLTDGYSAYRVLPNLTHAGCMAHARRKFDEAMATSPVIAAQALALIGKLYKVESECKSLDADARRLVRQRQSSGILLRLRLFLEEEQADALPQSKIGKAVGYALNQWETLCRFVDDGRLPIDNNAVEREMKAIATGRKNRLFFGSPRGGCAAAGDHLLDHRRRPPPRPRRLAISGRYPPPPRRPQAGRTRTPSPRRLEKRTGCRQHPAVNQCRVAPPSRPGFLFISSETRFAGRLPAGHLAAWWSKFRSIARTSRTCDARRWPCVKN